MAKKVVLAGACRTAIGKMGGQFGNTPAVELGSIVIKEALNRAGVKPELQGSRSNDCIAYVQALQYLHFGFRPNAGSNLYRLCFS